MKDFHLLSLETGCEIDLNDKHLEESSDDSKYPLIVDKNGDLIYPVGERILRFGKQFDL